MGEPVVPSDVIDTVLRRWFHQRLLMHTVLWKQVQPTSIPGSGLVNVLESQEDLLLAPTPPTLSMPSPSII